MFSVKQGGNNKKQDMIHEPTVFAHRSQHNNGPTIPGDLGDGESGEIQTDEIETNSIDPHFQI